MSYAQTSNEGKKAMSKPPEHVIRFGLIKGSIWRNQTRAGERFTITIVRLFKNGDHWTESTRFGRDDLLLVAKVCDLAHSWIFAQRGSSVESSDHKSKSEGANHGQVS